MKYTPEQLVQMAIKNGACKAAVIEVKKVPFSTEFRAACEANACGVYGRCWMCPPDIGPIDQLIAKASGYQQVLVYQTVSDLEDSFDFEGMQEAGNRHNKLSMALQERLAGEEVLHLGAGGCRVCERCAKLDNEPCRAPDKALSSLEAYGINVSRLAPAAGMNYINGQNTVTYFGAVFFND